MSFLNQYDAIPAADVMKRAALVGGWLRSAELPAFYAELRERRPIFPTPVATFVAKYPDVVEVLSRPEIFTVDIYRPKMDPTVGPFMLSRDRTPLNWKDKSIMKSMTPESDLPRVRDMVGTLADQILDTCVVDGKIEVIQNLARGVPVRIVGDYFGFPGPDVDTMLRWSNATQTNFFKNLTNNPELQEASVKAGQEMQAWIKDFLPKRRAELESGKAQPTDVVSRLLMTTFADNIGFDESSLVSNICGLLVGTVETSQQAIAQALQQILMRPPVQKAAVAAAKQESMDEFDAIVWEALRFNPINPLLFRYTSTDAVIAEGTAREARIPKGTTVFACTPSAMWDPDVVERPDEFVPGRPSYVYMHFGYGEHICLGQPTGMVMLPEVIRRILLRGASPVSGPEGQIDFEGGPFPVKYYVAIGEQKSS